MIRARRYSLRPAQSSSRRTWVATLLLSALPLSFAAPPAAHAADGAWTELPPPEYRINATAVYDRVHHRMILFGGLTNGVERNDVWVLEIAQPNRWRRLQPTGTPPSARRSHTAVYDPIQNRMIVFGGGYLFDHTWYLNNEVWSLELGGAPHWTLLTPIGTKPLARFASVAAFDVARNRMLLHGGARADGSTIGDLWRLELSGTPAWVQVSSSTAMGPRAFASAVVDSARDRMLVMGGISSLSSLGDTWQCPLGGGAWSQVGTTGAAPATLSHASAFDPLHDQMIVFGGLNIATGTYLQGAWRLQFSPATPTWSRAPLTGAVPPAMEGASAIYDPIASEFRIFGGWSGPSEMDSISQNVWTLALHPAPSWNAPFPANAPPAAGRSGASVAYDAQNQRMLMIGGWRNDLGGPGASVDVWALDLTAATPLWTPVTPVGTAPAGRAFASLVYDPSEHRLILYGGEAQGTRHADAWSLSLTSTPTWTPLTPTGTPPAGRSRHGAIYDPVRDQMVVFGGNTVGFPGFEDDVWALSFSGAPAWAQLSPAGTPPSRRHGMAVALDAPRDRMIVFGGLSDTPPAPTKDVWALNLAGATAWEPIEVAAGPAPRRAHTAVVDPARDRLLIFGGYADAGGGPLAVNDLWALPLSGPPAWNALQPAAALPKPDAEHAAIYDVIGDRMITYGGVGGLNATWIYQPDAVLAAPPLALPTASVRIRATPNPSRGPVELSFVLPAAGRAQVEVYDIGGRRIARVVDATLPAGPHAARWNGRVGDRTAPAGVYLARFEHAGGAAITRLLVVR
jgi:hypothetical protein